MQEMEIGLEVITNEDLKKRTETVKNIANSWAADISALISQSEEWKEYSNEPCTKFALYHITKGEIKNQLLRRIYMNASAKYISQAKEQIQKFKNEVNI